MSTKSSLLARAKVGIAFLMILSAVAIVVLLLLHPVTLTADAKTLIEALLGPLAATLVFVVHAIFAAPHTPASSTENPIQPANPAPSIGVKPQ